MPPPTGGRAHADYAEEHRTAIGRYVRQRDRCLRANIEGASDPYKGCSPLVRKGDYIEQ